MSSNAQLENALNDKQIDRQAHLKRFTLLYCGALLPDGPPVGVFLLAGVPLGDAPEVAGDGVAVGCIPFGFIAPDDIEFPDIFGFSVDVCANDAEIDRADRVIVKAETIRAVFMLSNLHGLNAIEGRNANPPIRIPSRLKSFRSALWRDQAPEAL